MILKPSAAFTLQPAAQATFTVDLFCRVIDNFGDAGVCLRLARALVLHQACSVRLFCDDVPLLARLEPCPPAGLCFLDWQAQQHAAPVRGVVCGFGCTLEPEYLAHLVAMQPQPAYLHLEYLSAEPWVESTHGLVSVHPRLLTRQRFCNPGFNVRTGGVLHEPAAFDDDQALATLRQWGSAVPEQALRVFVFAYPTDSFDGFLAAAQHTTQAIHWVLPQGAAGQQLWHALHGRAQHSFTRLPFVAQAQFDAALRSCQRAWVRGEDSAMCALFAGLPMVWQLYPQDDGAHTVKTRAYVDAAQRAVADHEAQAFERWRGAMYAANGVAWSGACAAPNADSNADNNADSSVWTDFFDPSAVHVHAKLWAQHCAAHSPDLALTVATGLKNWKIN